ncbi:CAP domain-containing protein [Gracilibacillus massiliensis]|uniref:CAP domain-containing protein n=1 Tax=Gracilibacillus massiliensis TaxID=1564956 RepID=UPI00071D8B8B|nr:CAP domain-containing protein [Gracilibacillus massiliensis]
MKYKVIAVISFLFVGISLSYFYFSPEDEPKKVIYHKKQSQIKDSKVQFAEDHTLIEQQDAIWKYINQDVTTIQSEIGNPDRKDPSMYNYDWWIYNNENYYLQIAVKNNKIISLYSNSPKLDFRPLIIGQDIESLEDTYTFHEEIEVDHLKFKLSEQDLKQRPIVRLSEKIFAQLYIDQFTNKLVGIRVLNKEALEILKPYELFYWGELKEVETPKDNKRNEIEESIEKQIFEITNELRSVYELDSLTWDDQAAEAAKNHSIDMVKKNYFSHYSQNGDGLKERLLAVDAYYLVAGENIAAHYIDGPAVIHGWLNSEGHREALLKEDYTHLGVGVYQSYYTQNFLGK